MRIGIPIIKDKGLDSEVSGHFGQAEYFIIINLKSEIKEQEVMQDIDIESLDLEYFVIQNEGAQACTARVDLLLNNRIDILLVEAIGGKPFEAFKQHGVKIYSGAVGIVKEVLQNYMMGRLEELGEGVCGDLMPHYHK
jgi:predicted Fe-Mo cluster-binding NifX family protein